MKNILLLLTVLLSPLLAAEKTNKPLPVNSNGCACHVEGPDEICEVDSTIELKIMLMSGKDNVVTCDVEIKGTSDARWGDKDGDKKFTANLKCDGSNFRKATLWTGTKTGVDIEIWVNKSKCKTITVVKCPTETITPKEGKCSGGEYGGTFVYSYPCAKGWWFREEVTPPAGKLCGDTRQLHQRRDPQQLDADSNSIIDEIMNEGDPSALANGCQETNSQQVFIGPTEDACVNDPCVYNHTHTITVTPTPDKPGTGTVVTAVSGQSTTCSF